MHIKRIGNSMTIRNDLEDRKPLDTAAYSDFDAVFKQAYEDMISDPDSTQPILYPLTPKEADDAIQIQSATRA